ncbi:hypothetical protein Zmor_003954 [Zophobas morio]|jgi:hypothetical protein|uniref:Uncharacterized protein n=1 Tax=Zophobas morio TaxID=2755281 RepID=A0AA38HN83_9CUCU|nr:hypothetical protein Zmor_003954 [Zophobas morio]
MQRERIGGGNSESQLLPNFPVNLCNFSTYRQDRIDRGGGNAASLVRRNIQHSVIPLPALQSAKAVGASLHLTSLGSLSLTAAYESPPACHLTPQSLMPFL